MLRQILSFSIYRPWLVVLLSAILAVSGIFAVSNLSIDAVPDITNIQVQVNTQARGYTPLEVEQQITYPLESGIVGIPGLDYTRSLSRYGLSQITVVFEEGTNLYFARQVLSERLLALRDSMPSGITPKLGPVTTGLGEIVTYLLKKKDGCATLQCLSELRTLHDFTIAPQLRSIPGVTEVNVLGGHREQIVIEPDPQKLLRFGLTLHELMERVRLDNQNLGAGYVEENGEQVLVRIPLRKDSIQQVAEMTIGEYERGFPLRLKDVASVGLGKELRSGAATENGKEVVLGTTMMLIGENSREVTARVETQLREIQKSLPADTTLELVYSRGKLVDATIETVESNLFKAFLLVIAVLFLFLGNARAAIITALVIPFSMLMAAIGMRELGISANLMSLGALDFGLLVDGAVILVENCMRRLRAHGAGVLTKEARRKLLLDAAIEVRSATMFGELIIVSVYLPILFLGGIEGKMFFPMAATVALALAAAMVLSITFVPALVSLLFGSNNNAMPAEEAHGSSAISGFSERMIAVLARAYESVLTLALRHTTAVLGAALVTMIVTVLLFFQIGKEFLPELDEGDIALHALRIPGTSLSQAVQMQDQLERVLSKFPEVERVFTKIGTAEIANDPMPPNVADCIVILKPRAEWPNPGLPTPALVTRIRKAVQQIPGNNYEFTQPIRLRFNELLAGVRADVAIKFFGDDMSVLQRIAAEATQIVAALPGTHDTRAEQIDGLPVRTIDLKQEALGRFGLQAGEVQQYLQTALAGTEVSEMYRGDARIPIVIRFPKSWREDLQKLSRMPYPLHKNNRVHELDPLALRGEGSDVPFIPLSEVTEISVSEELNQISRENGKRRVVVSTNVEGVDLVGFVEQARQVIEQKVDIPEGYWVRYGGQFENYKEAEARLMLAIPLTLLIVCALLYFSLGSIGNMALALTGIPLALTGGILALLLRDIPLSISAAVGFIALSGISVLNGLVLLTALERVRRIDKARYSATAHLVPVACTRLRPVLMTALVASLGFVPMAISTGVGAEVQRPLATVVIGGIISSTLLTLIVLPCLYYLKQQRAIAALDDESKVAR